MAGDKVVTVTLPGGTRVTCREGLAARLGVKRSEATPGEAGAVEQSPRPRSSRKSRGRTQSTTE